MASVLLFLARGNANANHLNTSQLERGRQTTISPGRICKFLFNSDNENKVYIFFVIVQMNMTTYKQTNTHTRTHTRTQMEVFKKQFIQVKSSLEVVSIGQGAV